MMVVGTMVNKKVGYQFPGKVVAVFRTGSNAIRVVVEMYKWIDGDPHPTGLLHIFSPEQLENEK